MHKGAPYDLLLGTDAQSKLGCALVMETAEVMVDLFTGNECVTGRQHCGVMVHTGTASAESQPGTSSDQTHAEDCAVGGGHGIQAGSCPRQPHVPDSAGGLATLETEALGSAGGPETLGAEEVKDNEGPDAKPGGMLSKGLTHCNGDKGELPGREPPSGAHHHRYQLADDESGSGVVRLLKAEKIPAGYRNMVHAQVSGEMETSLLLFTPDLDSENILLADAVVEGACATLVIGNKGLGPIQVKIGTVLGTVVPVDEVSLGTGLSGGEVTVGEGSWEAVDVDLSNQGANTPNHRVYSWAWGAYAWSEREATTTVELASNPPHTAAEDTLGGPLGLFL